MPGGRHGLQNRRPGTPCRGVGSIPTLSAISSEFSKSLNVFVVSSLDQSRATFLSDIAILDVEIRPRIATRPRLTTPVGTSPAEPSASFP